MATIANDMLENTAHGFVRIDNQARIWAANPTFKAWANDPAVTGGTKRITAYLAPASRIYFDTHVMPQTLMTGRIDEVALDLQWASTRIPLLTSARRHRTEDGVDWIMLTMLPVHERRRYERELLTEKRNAETALVDLRDAQARLLVLSRTAAVNVTATSLAHEMNQPLMAASAYLAGAKRLHAADPTDPRFIHAIDEAINAIQTADGILKTLRHGTSGLKTNKNLVAVRLIIDRAWEIAGGKVDAHRLRVRIPAVLPWVRCDLEHVAYALMELLLNSLEATVNTDRDIVVIEALPGQRGAVRIEVEDEGPGLPAGDIFDIGFTTKAGHRGVGLANARTIVEAEGGIVGFLPAPLRGCRAFLELPGLALEFRETVSEPT